MFEVGINFNTDLPINHIVKGVNIAEEYGYDYVWIGESFQYSHSIPIAALISKVTEKIKIGIIVSPKIDQCAHIVKSIQTLREAYGERYAVGLVPGDALKLEAIGLKIFNALEEIRSCIKNFPRPNLRVKLNFDGHIPKLCKLTPLPIYIGASGPKMINEGSKIADGLLLNYINPELVKWALEFIDVKNCCIAAFGPILLKPAREELLMALRISTAIVASGANKSLVKKFNIEKEVEEIKKIFVKGDFNALKKYDEFLIKKFAIYGNIKEVKNKIEKLKRIGVDQIIFGAPFCKDLEGIKKIGEILK
jgi:5,10-methylenetetrahydromethanopterin reductase